MDLGREKVKLSWLTNTLLWFLVMILYSLEWFVIFRDFAIVSREYNNVRERQREESGKREEYETMVMVKIANQELSIRATVIMLFHLPLCSFSSPSSCPCPSLHSSKM